MFKDITGFSQPNRYFYMSLYNLSLKYPKIRQISINYSQIKNHLRSLEQHFIADAAFWQ